MIVHFNSAAIAFLVAALSISASGAKVQTPAPTARAAAEQWLALVDGGRSDESWRQAAESFKVFARTPEGWSASVQRVRGALGALRSRTFRGVTAASTSPSGQRGVFEIVQFDSVFENRLGTTFETVATTRENDGQWRVESYHVK